VQTMQFDAHVFHAEPGSVTVAGKKFDARALEYSPATPPVGGDRFRWSPCRPTQVPAAMPPTTTNLPVNGAVVLVDRGTCPFAPEGRAPPRNVAPWRSSWRTTSSRSRGRHPRRDHRRQDPRSSASPNPMAHCFAPPWDRRPVQLSAETKTIQARNVIAQTKTGFDQRCG